MKTPKVSKTRVLMVDVARRLFAQYGKENVTMNDIAVASGKGRRTLYTYFGSKDEVYLAVIENELDLMVERLQGVLRMPLSPEKKLEEYVFVHFEAVKEAITRNGSLRADFFRNIYEVEKARRPIDIKEIRMIREIMEEGAVKGVFRLQSTQWAAMMFLYALKGMETPYINNNISNYIKDHRAQIMNVILNGFSSNKYEY
ncbi:MAG: TetR/AcrR family transcriptional regulator [Paludibacteraceae bacterium]|jgi:AcrR family transcriptional regulator|nr:TetR/AcrR family transcriptional regulator [Paludibacteraceae bacterium]